MVRKKFNSTNLSFNGQLFVNLIILICAVVYWIRVEFSWYLFVIGIFSGSLESVGKVSITTAVVIGRAGPASALASLAGVELVIFEAVKAQKMITTIELISLLLGFVGSLILVVPQMFTMLCCFCFNKD